ncbi:MAG: hypothetical protein O7G85_14640 [Planctomycetota bacterium]|nr:hypothetical protein [Planctomycetota bacterium]
MSSKGYGNRTNGYADQKSRQRHALRQTIDQHRQQLQSEKSKVEKFADQMRKTRHDASFMSTVDVQRLMSQLETQFSQLQTQQSALGNQYEELTLQVQDVIHDSTTPETSEATNNSDAVNSDDAENESREIEQAFRQLGPDSHDLLDQVQLARKQAGDLAELLTGALLEQDNLVTKLQEIQREANQNHAQNDANQEVHSGSEREEKKHREEMHSRLEELQGDRDVLNTRLEELEMERPDLVNDRDEAKAQVQELEDKLQSALSERQDAESKAESIEQNSRKIKFTLQDRDTQIDQLTKRLAPGDPQTLTNALHDAGEQIAVLKQSVGRMQQETDQAIQESESHREQLLEANEAAREHGEAHESERVVRKSLEQQLSELRNDLNQAGESKLARESELTNLHESHEQSLQRFKASFDHANEKIQRQTEELEHQGDMQDEIRDLEEKLSQVEETKHELATTREASVKLQGHIDQLETQIQSGQADHIQSMRVMESSLEEAQEKQLHDSLEQQTKTQRQLEEMQSKLVEAREIQRELETKGKANEGLQERVGQLESELIESRKPAEPVDVSALVAVPEEIERMRDHLREIAQHLQIRQQRLQRMRTTLKQQPSSKSNAQPRDDQAQQELKELKKKLTAAIMDERQKIADEKRRMSNDRHRLAHLQETLQGSERKMMKKWARQNSILVTSAFVLMMVIVGSASWFTADFFMPAQVAASVTLKPNTKSVNPLTEAMTSTWQNWHSELVASEDFRETLTKRMHDRQMPVEDIDLASWLDGKLTFDTMTPDEVTMTISGTNRALVADMLDVLVSTILVESTRHANQRTDGAWSEASNERNEGGVSRYASFNPLPLNDSRLMYVGPVFGFYFLLTAALFIVIRKQHRRAKEVIGNDPVLEGSAAFLVDEFENESSDGED